MEYEAKFAAANMTLEAIRKQIEFVHDLNESLNLKPTLEQYELLTKSAITSIASYNQLIIDINDIGEMLRKKSNHSDDDCGCVELGSECPSCEVEQ